MWPNSQFPADLVTFTEEILNEKLHFVRIETTDFFNQNLKLWSSLNRTILKSICLKSETYALREKCPYLEYFWSVFSRIRTKYGEIHKFKLTLRVSFDK